MAVPTVVIDNRHVRQLDGSSFGLVSGGVSVTNYDTAHPEVTAITGLFKNKTVNMRVVVAGVSSAGYAIRWDKATLSFMAFATGASSGAALSEAVATTAVGTFDFIAMGQMG